MIQFSHFLSTFNLESYLVFFECSMLESFDELDYNVQLLQHELDPPLLYSCAYQLQHWGYFVSYKFAHMSS